MADAQDENNNSVELDAARDLIQLDLAERMFPEEGIDEKMGRWVDEGHSEKFRDIIDEHPEILEEFLKDPDDAKDEIEGLMREMQ